MSNLDTLELRLAASSNPLKEPDRARALFEILENAGSLRPDASYGKFKGTFDAVALPKRLATIAASSVSLVLRRQSPAVEYSFSFGGDETFLVAKVEMEAFRDETMCDALLDLVRQIAGVLSVQFARAHDEADAELSDEKRDWPLRVPTHIDDVYWMTLWGRELVDLAGRERVLTTPNHRIEQLPDGGVLLLTRPTPVDALAAEARRAQAKALAHLTRDATEEEVYARLMVRSQRLRAVGNDLDPDVAPLLELIIGDAAKANREREQERLNAFRALPVEEVREPGSSAELDPRDAEAEYDDLAEELIALLREQVPEIESFDPAIVPKVDYWMWRLKLAEDAERSDVEELLVPALGAYIALVMVKKLGGTLVPRTKLDESQVVIGGRAWLPFLRARHALASRDAQLTHSMTQFIAVAQRG